MRLAIFALSLLLLSGCVTLKQGPTDSTETPLSHSTPAIRGSAVLEFIDESVLRGHAVIVARPPASVRIELRGPLGHTTWAMTSSGTTISIYSDGKSRVYSPGDPELPYRVTSHELVSYLFGLAPVASPTNPETAEYRISRDGDGQITEALKYIEGKPVLSVELDDYRIVSGRNLPFLITIKDMNRSLNIHFSTIEINPEINETLFEEFFKYNKVTD